MRYLLIGVLTLLTSAALAEDRDVDALLSHGDDWKAFTQAEWKHSEIGADDAEFAGLAIGWTLDKTWSIGLAGYGMFTDIEPRRETAPLIDDLRLWYAGVRGEYTWNRNKRLHLSAHLLAGGGEVEAETGLPDNRTKEESRLLIVEPGVDLAVNVYDFLEIGVGIGHIFVFDADVTGLSENELSEFNGKIFFRFRQPKYWTVPD